MVIELESLAVISASPHDVVDEIPKERPGGQGTHGPVNMDGLGLGLAAGSIADAKKHRGAMHAGFVANAEVEDGA